MARIVLISPRFEPSFFGGDYVLPFVGLKARFPISALTLLAALVPEGHEVVLVDEAAGPIDFDEVAKADIVGLTGMVVQRVRMLEIARELKARGAFLAVGGPWVTARPDYFDGLADVVFVGEADTTWPQFLTEWSRGQHATRYEQSERTDVTTLPTPRFDLVDMSQFEQGAIQISRGCPFRCEFCDIIVMFGRVPRVKTAEQVIRELDLLRAQNVKRAFLVDDNFIGNKRLVKPILEAIIAWQEANGHPMKFSTEASLNLAEEDELREMMVEAGIIGVFVGVESINEEALVETKKVQNLKRRSSDGCLTVADDIRRRLDIIQDSGLQVFCGTIVGFDSDRPDVFDNQLEFFRKAPIPAVTVGMLSAIPGTPLYARLDRDGRLDHSDPPEHGTNVVPMTMSGPELRDGYVRLMKGLYAPDAYFERVEQSMIRNRRVLDRMTHTGTGPLRRRASVLIQFLLAWIHLARLARFVSNRRLGLVYFRRTLSFFLRRGGRMSEIAFYVKQCAMHFHFFSVAEDLAEARIRNTF